MISSTFDRAGAVLATGASRSDAGDPVMRAGTRGQPVRNPADHDDIVGTAYDATPEDVAAALRNAAGDGMAWAKVRAVDRAARLERAAELLELHRAELIALAVREAGKSMPNAAGEVREAVDFCRFYAAQAARELDGVQAIGPVACITPWNFPLAIFVGEISAALAAGNPVLAKPAEQTPLMAAAVVALFHQAGIPPSALQLLPGPGETVGAALVADSRIKGVLFTGSTAVAQLINRQLALRDEQSVLIAETGGQNAMIVDSSALPEQVVLDAIASAFDSAAQRCSALRILCVQDDIADRVFAMLEGAMTELVVGDPRRLSTDVGPVIDRDAQAGVVEHVERMRAAGLRVFQPVLSAETAGGTFVPPTIIEIQSVTQLEQEIFGPVLHVLRYRRDDLRALVDAINATGYGLTHGIQSRIDETVDEIVSRIDAGNIYVNRNIIGAVVGVQPFGGAGLSGTGPKAGGALYLRRLVRGGGNADMGRDFDGYLPGPLRDRLAQWIGTLSMIDDAERRRLISTVDRLVQNSTAGFPSVMLPGPTGETNRWSLQPRGTIGCAAEVEDALPAQIVAALATGNRVLVPNTAIGRSAAATIGSCTVSRDASVDLSIAEVDAVLVSGSLSFVLEHRARAAARDGPLLPVITPDSAGRYDAERLLIEKVVTINTTASGGNAELLAIAG